MKVLLLSASVGSGHVRAAQAVGAHLTQLYPDCQVKSFDMLDYANPLFKLVYSKLYLKIATGYPNVFESMYERSDVPWKDNSRRELMAKINIRGLTDQIVDFAPDIIVSTHFLASDLVSRLKKNSTISTKLAVVVTDMDMHAWWLCRGADHYFISSDEVREYLRVLGVPLENVTVAGIPIDSKFSTQYDKHQIRQSLGLNADKTTFLISSGGDSCGPTMRIIEQLSSIKKPSQFIVVCGRNTKLKNALDQYVQSLQDSIHSFCILGFTDIMDKYMSAADVLVGKTGGLTTAEALAKNLAIVIVEPLKGQEQRNSDNLLEEGVAIRCNNLATLAFKVEKLLSNTDRLIAMQNNAQRIAHPDAAAVIANKLIELTS